MSKKNTAKKMMVFISVSLDISLKPSLMSSISLSVRGRPIIKKYVFLFLCSFFDFYSTFLKFVLFFTCYFAYTASCRCAVFSLGLRTFSVERNKIVVLFLPFIFHFLVFHLGLLYSHTPCGVFPIFFKGFFFFVFSGRSASVFVFAHCIYVRL